MIHILLHLVIIFSSFGGFILAFYISHKKRANETLVCPLDADCDAVIRSEYSTFFGVPVELLGMVYYTLIAFGYALFIIVPGTTSPLLVFVVIVATTSAFLFSVYLTFIQLFALRQWCTWCLVSAFICTVIFAAALAVSEFGFITLLEWYRGFIVVAHFLGIVLGVGGTTIACVFFFQFLKDLKISFQEANVIRSIFQVIWFSLGIVFITEIGLFLPFFKELSQSPIFFLKIVILVIVITSGALLNFFVNPRLVELSFNRSDGRKAQESPARKAAFALSAVSFVSWYSLFVLVAINKTTISVWTVLEIYLIFLLLAVIVSQIVERLLAKQVKG